MKRKARGKIRLNKASGLSPLAGNCPAPALTSDLLRNPGVLLDTKLGFVMVEQGMDTNFTT